MISYGPLWKTIARLNITRPQLKEMCNLHSNTYAKLNNNKHVSLETIENICNILNCNIEDIIEYVPNK